MTNHTKFDFGELPEGPWTVEDDDGTNILPGHRILDKEGIPTALAPRTDYARAIAAMLAEIERLDNVATGAKVVADNLISENTRLQDAWTDAEVGRDKLRARNAELREALETFIRLHGEFLMDAGPCDHSVGICICPEIAAFDKARALLSKEES